MATAQPTVIRPLFPRVKGTTFDVVTFTLTIKSSGLPVDITGYTFEADYRRRCKTGEIVKSISTASGITITDATNGVYRFDLFTPVSWEVETYWYGVKATAPSGIITEPVQGTVEILQNIPD